MNTPNIVILDADTLGNAKDLARFQALGNTKLYPFTPPGLVDERIREAQIVLTNKVCLRSDTLVRAKALELICITATGMNNVDLDTAKNLGIQVSNVAGYAADSVAQHTFAVLLQLVNQLRYYNDYIKAGKYAKSPIFTHIHPAVYQLKGKQLGIIGLGNIGRAVAKIGDQGFGMRVGYHSVSGRNMVAGYPHLSLPDLLATSDVVSIHTALNAKTSRLINLARLKQMKPEAILINMGRGSIVVAEDLAQAVDEGIIAGACTDVFAVEPAPLDHPLLQAKKQQRLVLTPHMAWTAQEAREQLLSTVADRIKLYIAEQKGKLLTT